MYEKFQAANYEGYFIAYGKDALIPVCISGTSLQTFPYFQLRTWLDLFESPHRATLLINYIFHPVGITTYHSQCWLLAKRVLVIVHQRQSHHFIDIGYHAKIQTNYSKGSLLGLAEYLDFRPKIYLRDFDVLIGTKRRPACLFFSPFLFSLFDTLFTLFY